MTRCLQLFFSRTTRRRPETKSSTSAGCGTTSRRIHCLARSSTTSSSQLLDRPDDVFVGSATGSASEGFSGELQYLFQVASGSITGGFGISASTRHRSSSRVRLHAFGVELVTFQTVTDDDSAPTRTCIHTSTSPTVRSRGPQRHIFTTQAGHISRSQVNPKLGSRGPSSRDDHSAAAFGFERTLITDKRSSRAGAASTSSSTISTRPTLAFGAAVVRDSANALRRRGFSARLWRAVQVDRPRMMNHRWDRVRRVRVRNTWRARIFLTPLRGCADASTARAVDNEADGRVLFQGCDDPHGPLGTVVSSIGLQSAVQIDDTIRAGTSCGAARPPSNPEDNFWLLDAGISYRFPKRYGIASIGATNLLDQQFKYQETDFRNARIVPSRGFFARLTFQIP